MSTGIYKYENNLNGKIYIGLSSNIQQRYSQHLTAARSNLPNEELMKIDLAIRKYGIDNFSFEIIEECSEEQLDEREIYWISYYDSYHNGYNNTIGGRSLRGENHPRAILTEQDVWEIREQYGKKIKRSIAFRPYLERGIKERTLIKVWYGETWVNIHNDVYSKENKEWHKNQHSVSNNQKKLSSQDRKIKKEEVQLFLKDYNDGMTINAIAKKYHRDNGTIEKYINNPNQMEKVNYNGRKVQNIETGKIFNSINSASKWANCGATTLTRHLASDCTAGKIPNLNIPAHWKELS